MSTALKQHLASSKAKRERKKKKQTAVHVCMCKACWDERWEGPHLHGDVCDGGGRQVKVLLDQDVEFGGQVAAGPNAVHLAGQQGGHL